MACTCAATDTSVAAPHAAKSHAPIAKFASFILAGQHISDGDDVWVLRAQQLLL